MILFCLVENEFVAKDFLTYLNNKHPNIKFTMEIEKDKMIPFLDVLITSPEEGNFLISVFRKSTFTGLLLNFTSYTPLSYKLGLIKTLIHRAFKISYNWITFHKEMELVKNYLGKNAYPPSIVDKEIKTYINKIHTKKNAENEKKQKTYTKLPYIGKYSKFAQNKIKHLCDIFCKETHISLVFSSTKLASFFQIKDKIPSALKSFVVYKFTCANCNVSYVGETCRHLDVRVEEHFKSASSHMYKHLSNQHACKAACDKSLIKEAIPIN